MLAAPSRLTKATLLCVANYPSNTGFAWDFIERLYARLADHLATHGVRTLVAYPQLPCVPRTLANSAAEPVLLDATLRSVRSLLTTRSFIRREGVRVLYFTDRTAWSWRYPLLRTAGARRILMHDHTSGARTPPRGVRAPDV